MPNRWNEIAKIRKQQIESGIDLTFCDVFLPYYKDIIARMRPVSLLEIGCGTGHLAADLSKDVSRCVAIEPSSGMYAVAADVLRHEKVELLSCPIEKYLDAGPFCMILSHLCAQVIDDLNRFLEAVASNMDQYSTFVFSIPHPCFYNDYKHFFSANEFQYMSEVSKTISFSITKDPDTSISGIPYHHRPLSHYFAALQEQGLCVTDWIEIYPDAEVQEKYGRKWEVPRYCVFHCCRLPNNHTNKQDESGELTG